MRLEYGVNVGIPIEYKMHNPCIVAPIDMTTCRTMEEGIVQLDEAEHLGPKEEI